MSTCPLRSRFGLITVLLLVGLLVVSSTRAEEIVAESTFLSVIRSAEIPARDLGVIESLKVREGQSVEAGQLVAELNQAEAELDLEKTATQLEIARREARNQIREALAKKTTEVARVELERAEEANRKYPDTVSQTEVARLRLLAEKAALEGKQAVHEQEVLDLNATLAGIEHEIATTALKRRSILSPLKGIVERIDRQPGEWVQPGTTLVKVIDLSTLRAEAVLPAKYRHHQLLDAPVSIAVPGNGDNASPLQVEGSITYVHPQFDPIDGSFRVWATLDNAEHLLRPGESVTMVIHIEEPSGSRTSK
ncbi:efflux RND transporter periplasmic adaptor subunit [Rubinisphaera margarita]|uniref:efflux RND transporter periplasmic adaptor subunit n=1 Tax=Rubinisphaera margarita TaxID=2909586 RepID=UPI001EE81F38|nr:HlyD family efflux transporter periplasmic adaptor subunit [Rubinisphaera margarita]MCG6156680.1 HlyD family efflux transporter periplasmic adaptor subunit [Rubinisphaera margarita]